MLRLTHGCVIEYKYMCTYPLVKRSELARATFDGLLCKNASQKRRQSNEAPWWTMMMR